MPAQEEHRRNNTQSFLPDSGESAPWSLLLGRSILIKDQWHRKQFRTVADLNRSERKPKLSCQYLRLSTHPRLATSSDILPVHVRYEAERPEKERRPCALRHARAYLK